MRKKIKRLYWRLHKGVFGRNFSRADYRLANPDIATTGMDSWEHYVKYGRKEGRKLCAKHTYVKDISERQRSIFIDKETCAPGVVGKIAVHLHLYYIDLIEDMIHYLNSIPYTFDLFVSVTNEQNVAIAYKELKRIRNVADICVETVPNRGRDIAPMICTFGERIRQYDYLCHLHTKKSKSNAHYDVLYYWRDYVIGSILGNEQTVKNIFHRLIDEQCGAVFATPYHSLSRINIKPSWGARVPDFSSICHRFLQHDIHPETLFPAGTMFWCRVKSLESLLTASISYADFPQEDGVLNDYSFAHVMERMMGYIPIDRGYTNYIIESPASRYFDNVNISLAKQELLLSCFDADFYGKMYPDVLAAGLDPLKHYTASGVVEGRMPCRSIPWDILECHLQKRGITNTLPELDLRFYLTTYMAAAMDFLFADIHPCEHYKQVGQPLGYLPNGQALSEAKKQKAFAEAKYSIIVPVYNSEHYLRHCLQSAYNQTAPNVEIIIINDGSPDNSHLVIEEFRQRYPERTIVITHECNKGLVCTHRDGIAAATGDYFTILDGDDWLDPTFCEQMGNLAIACDAPCVCCGWTRPSEYEVPEPNVNPPADLRVLEGEVKEKAIVHWKAYPNIHYGLNRKLYRLDSWREISPIDCDSHILYFEDAIVTLRYMMACSKVVILRNPYYHWFNNTDSVGNKLITTKYVNDIFDVIENLQYLRGQGQSAQELYVRNIDNIFITEYLQRLDELAKVAPRATKEVLECFAERFDQVRHLFTNKQAGILISRTMPLYYQACACTLGKEPSQNFVLFVEPVGIKHIQNFFLPYWEKNIKIEYRYIQCSYTCALSERLEKIRWGATCRCVVTTGGWSIEEFHTCRPIVQLWHGMGALKKVAQHPAALRPKLAFCSSKEVIPVYAELFGCAPKKVKPYGAIIADAYLDEAQLTKARVDFYNKYPQCRGKKLYLWCPTFRGSAPNIYLQDHLDFAELSASLSDNEILLVKFHPAVNGFKGTTDRVLTYHNVIDVTAEELYPTIAVADVFMTDYSSALHCAMLRNIPVCFLVTDEEQYTASQGLLVDYSQLPGPKCTTTNCQQILHVFRTARNNTPEYQRFRDYHVGGCQGDSCAKIAQSIFKFYRTVKK